MQSRQHSVCEPASKTGAGISIAASIAEPAALVHGQTRSSKVKPAIITPAQCRVLADIYWAYVTCSLA